MDPENTNQQVVSPQIPPTQPTPPDNTPQKSKKTLVMAGIAASLLVFGALGFVLGISTNKTPSSTPQTITPPIITKTVPTSTPAPATASATTNWKTYTNSQYGIQMKYPPTYLISDQFNRTNDVFFFSSVQEKTDMEQCFARKQPECNLYSLIVTFDSKPKAQTTTLQEYIRQEVKDDPLKYISLTVNGYRALQIQNGGMSLVNETYVDRNTNVFHIKADAYEDPVANITLYQQMLNTLQFTK